MSCERLTREECADRLLTISRPLIAMHARPDGDTCATAMALREVFSQLGREASLICDDPIPERLGFIIGDLPTDAFDSEMTPISVDVASPAQLGRLSEKLPPFALMIDHHSTGEPYAPYYILPDVSSASEVLFDVIEVLMERGLVRLTPALATHLYTAISSDTGRFCYGSATPTTYRLAARLIEAGADHARINHLLFNSKGRAQLLTEGFVADRLRTAAGGRIAYATVSRAERDSLGVPFSELESAIEVVRSLRGAEICFVVKETDGGDFRASIRSTGPVVSDVAKRFGGGGHALAAGCNPTGDGIEEAAHALVIALEAKLPRPDSV